MGAASLLQPSPVTEWFDRRFDAPTPAQHSAWPHIRDGRSVLILSPTGTGKTLAAFLGVLDELAREHAAGTLRDTIHAVYLSPLRALGYDLEKNLQGPLREIYGDAPPIRVGLRTGDTDTVERERQFRLPPHVLLTTPESLCLLLSQSKWLPHLESVRWVIIDELHALAENKRGAHLSISLERLEALRMEAPGAMTKRSGNAPVRPLQRIGLSATVAPASEAGGFLCGAGRAFEVVDVSAAKRIELRVHTPLQREPYPPAGFGGLRLVRDLGRLIRRHRTTLIFTNTRSGAESATYWLKDTLPDLANLIECHHASLDRDLRIGVEDRLKRGELRAVVCSTSLELGIDIGSIDLVVMIATPKGVSRALQRTGRAGHSIHEVSRGCLMATNVNDLVECCATVRLARAGHLEALRVQLAPLDVLAQHLMGMGCLRTWGRDEAFTLVTRAWPYRSLARAEFDDVLDYLAGGGRALRQQYTEVFGRIHLDDDTFEARAGAARRDFLENIGTIASEGVVRVLLGGRQLGTIEEGFLGGLRVGDVFVLAGRPVKLERVGNLECSVRRAEGEVPTVPRWNANKFPLANRVAQEIRRFRGELRARFESGETPAAIIPWIATRLDCGANNAAVIFRIHAVQHGVSEIPTGDFLLVEELDESTGLPPTVDLRPPRRRSKEVAALVATPQLVMPAVAVGTKQTGTADARATEADQGVTPARHYFFHALIGRSANDALSRVVGLRVSRKLGGNAIATADDYGFVLTLAPEQSLAADDIPALLDPAGFGADLEESMGRSHLLKYHFRNAAQTGLMVYRNYFGQQKAARKVQWSAEVILNVLVEHEPDHVLLREARRDAQHTFLEAQRAIAYLTDLRDKRRPIRLRNIATVPPLSFGMYATRIKEALLVEDPQETLERLYHHWWQKLGGAGESERAGPG